MNENLKRFNDLCKNIVEHEKSVTPLCAAENVVSPFAKIPLNSFIQEKYIMGGTSELMKEKNFMEAPEMFEFYKFLNDQCKKLFNSNYADPRALSGVNAVTVLLMSLFKQGDIVLISSEGSGGHSSMPIICKRLGISTIEIPFDYDKMDFNYNELNIILKTNAIAGILVCPSDLLKQPDFQQLKLPDECILIYDATQTLGLIASKENENILDIFPEKKQVILMGATHKTLPGPTCGLVLTKNMDLAEKFDVKVNPDYLRNVQFHHILSLSTVLLEMECYGEAYCNKIVYNANYLAKKLSEAGFEVLKADEKKYTYTHQIFISMNEQEMNRFFDRCSEFKISLNSRNKALYKDQGIRIGVQEVTRYGWEDEDFDNLTTILKEIKEDEMDKENIEKLINRLNKSKKVKYSFGENEYNSLSCALHNS